MPLKHLVQGASCYAEGSSGLLFVAAIGRKSALDDHPFVLAHKLLERLWLQGSICLRLDTTWFQIDSRTSSIDPRPSIETHPVFWP